MLPGSAESERAARILAGIPADGLFAAGQVEGSAPCRIGPDPFPLPAGLAFTLAAQGRLWLRFLKAAHALYLKSRDGVIPEWFAAYLDAGKPDRLLSFGRMNRFKGQVPMVLRPDLLLTDAGPVACELDSVPGGIGLLGCLGALYAAQGATLVGRADGMVDGFARALAHVAGHPGPRTAIVVSEESRMYLPEMRWLAARLRAAGVPALAAVPQDLIVDDAGVRLPGLEGAVDVVYRFFELFDLAQVPGAEALLEAAKLKRVKLTPPPKAHLEEKMLFALLHHPALAAAWEDELGAADAAALRSLISPTWIVDPRPLPPHAVIPGFTTRGRAIQSWDALAALTQRERALVIKPSGFSEQAWGSHGVQFGADLSQDDWAGAVRAALDAFPGAPHILQPYHRPAILRHRYWDPLSGAIREIEGRVRICPYYFVTGEDQVDMGGVLATVCPPDKKAIHGMPDAIMGPCAP